MKRRSFVKNIGLASLTAPFVVNNISFQAITKQLFDIEKSSDDHVLVIIRLNGGNDGLNTVFPIDQYDNLQIHRSNILIPENQIIPGTAELGFHPVMTGFSNLFNNGKSSVIQNVGYPQQNRSHFRSMDIWTSGSLDLSETRGWLGRHFDNQYPNYPNDYPNNQYPDPFAISMGNTISPTCQGIMTNFSSLVSNPANTVNLNQNQSFNDGTYYGCNIEYISVLIEQTNLYGAQINAAYNAGSSLSSLYYENNDPQEDFKSQLAKEMQYVAQMISGGLQTKVFILNIRGFDTHGDQVDNLDISTGEHPELIKNVSDAIEAFQDDIEQLGLDHRVLGMTFSEFGRQIASNGSMGTDHGDAAPMLLFGSCLANQIIGSNPIIEDQIPNQKGVDMQIDFRDIYASVLKDWFGVSSSSIDTIFDNHTVTYHNLIQGCGLNNNDRELNENTVIVYPNPAIDKCKIDFACNSEHIKIDLIDSQGRFIRNFCNKHLSQGNHSVTCDLSEISSGLYIVQIKSEQKQYSTSLKIGY